MPRLVRVVAWVEIMGNRAETTFTVKSPWVCEGACPVLQQKSDEAVAAWVFQWQCKKGFTVETVTADDYNARDHGEVGTAGRGSGSLSGRLDRRQDQEVAEIKSCCPKCGGALEEDGICENFQCPECLPPEEHSLHNA
jgi:tRNA(Ile2) C34 agmatinyltransferase TiaS